MQKILLSVLILFLFQSVYCQTGVDKCVSQNIGKPDSVIAKLLCDSSMKYRRLDFNLCYDYASMANKFALKSNVAHIIARSYNYLGVGYHLLNKHSDAIKNYIQAEKIYFSINDIRGYASSRMNIGILNRNIKSHIESEKDFKTAIKFATTTTDTLLIANCYSNLSGLFFEKNELDSALVYGLKSLKIKLACKTQKLNLSSSYTNLSTIYADKREYKSAAKYEKLSLSEAIANNDEYGAAVSYANLGSSYTMLGEFKNSKIYLDSALFICYKIGYLDIVPAILSHFSDYHKLQGNHEMALEYYFKSVKMRDSITQKTHEGEIAELQTKYETEKKQNEINDLNFTNQSQKTQLDKDAKLKTYLYLIIALSVIAAGIMLYSYKTKQKANKQLQIFNQEITYKNHQIEEQHKEIKDSINYAKRIQEALLIPESELKKYFSDAFILFKPKDVVSGDFYWFSESKKNNIIALADCTGHGVPGGFMSMLGYEMLQDILLKEEVKTTSVALSQLDIKLTETLNKNNRTYRDSMDMSLLAFNKTKNTLQFSGANRPLLHFSNGELKIYNGDKNAIGGAIDDVTKTFTHTDIDCKSGDVFYIFSDGYADQFGGPKGKKFKYKQLEELLKTIYLLPLASQQEILNSKLQEWKGSLEQVDDITIIGIRA
jgi:serine phosphatase RsbU (regulator of sigma subunit)